MVNEIKQELPVLQIKDPYLSCTVQELNTLKKQLQKQQRDKVQRLVKIKAALKQRNEAFGPQFSQFKRNFNDMVQYCRHNWGVHLELSAVDGSPLDEPIRLMIDDPELDHVLKHTVTLNHDIAAFMLQLAINITIGSQFIIIDSIDEFVEPCLIA